MESRDQAAGQIERSVSLFKRGFDVGPSLSPDTYGVNTPKAALCRSCFRRFAPSSVRGGRHECPHCHGDQEVK
jgi:hypothetical protein